MTPYASPILTSLLDTDAYKLHMQQAVYHRYRNISVVAEFRCRGDELLGEYASEIREQIQMMSQLALTNDEFTYLSGLPFFKHDYLNWLKAFRYNPEHVTVSDRNGHLHVRIEGPWRQVIMWEVPLLAVISEVVHRHRSPQVTAQMAVDQLRKNLASFKEQAADIDLSAFRLMDFGTRRRFSGEVQEAIVSTLKNEFPYLVGTSNYDVAHKLQLTPVGTQAHEWFQALY